MNPLPLVEKAGAYLNVQLTHLGPAPHPHQAGPFVTLSRESGTGGTTLAHALASRLPTTADRPWVVHSANLIEEMLETNNLPPHLARFLPEDRVSEIDASVGEIVGLHPNLWTLVRKTSELIRQLAQAGHALILGRGANFASAGVANGVHVRLVAPPDFRAERTALVRGTSVAAARDFNAGRDAARARYVRAHFSADIADPAAYDLVLNVARVAPDDLVATIVRLVAAHTLRSA